MGPLRATREDQEGSAKFVQWGAFFKDRNLLWLLLTLFPWTPNCGIRTKDGHLAPGDQYLQYMAYLPYDQAQQEKNENLAFV